MSGEQFLDTVIVIGAGASADYGYPIGDKLKSEVAEQLLKSDKEWIRHISERINALGSKSLDKYLMETGHPANEIAEIKRAIGVILFDREVRARVSGKLYPQDANDWITDLARQVWDGKKQFRDGQKIKVITFNYDRLFEWKLYNYAFNRLDPSQRSDAFIFNEFIKKYFEIFHVYGRLPAFNVEEGEFLIEGIKDEVGLIPFSMSHRPWKAEELPEAIWPKFFDVAGIYIGRNESNATYILT